MLSWDKLLRFEHGRALDPHEFNHFIGRPEYVTLMRNRMIVPAHAFNEWEIGEIGKLLEDWLQRNATDLYHMRYSAGANLGDNRFEIYFLSENDAFSMKLSLHQTNPSSGNMSF